MLLLVYLYGDRLVMLIQSLHRGSVRTPRFYIEDFSLTIEFQAGAGIDY